MSMMDWNGYRAQVLAGVGELGKLSPDTTRGYMTLGGAGAKTGHLDARTRELIALACAVTLRCDGCITVHSEAARKLGATPEEVAEALGVAVALARRETAERLDRLIAETRDDAQPFPWAAIRLEGDLDDLVAVWPAIEAEDRYRMALRNGRNRDRAAGRTLIGPQSSDLVVRHGPKDVPAGTASTGEQKALLIGLVLAHARLVRAMSGIAPLILLDEVAAHLDPRRRAGLFEALEALPGQVWMTGADPGAFAQAGTRTEVLRIGA